jgi:hypothetical protein
VTCRDLDDEEVLSRYGRITSNPPFRWSPRRGESEMSLFLGRMSPHEVAEAVNTDKYGALVRHTTVGRLRAVGFVVVHDPTLQREDHVTVRYPGKWDRSVSEAFRGCFDEE